MMGFGRAAPTRVEKIMKTVEVYAPESYTSESGRERFMSRTRLGAERCVISVARSEEVERFHQRRARVTHTLLTRFPGLGYENCELVDEAGRRFRVRAAMNKGGLNVFTAYYCEEWGEAG